jgi:hypothetical protein
MAQAYTVVRYALRRLPRVIELEVNCLDMFEDYEAKILLGPDEKGYVGVQSGYSQPLSSLSKTRKSL